MFGGLVIHSRQVLTRAETAFAKTANQLNTSYAARNEADVRAKSEFFTNSFDEILAILPSDRTRKQVLIGRTKEQKDLWGVRLLKMELASNRSKIATKSLDVRLDWFDDFNKRLTASSPAFKDAVIERDTLTNEWANSRIVLETNCQTAHFCADVEKERQNLLSAKDDGLLSIFYEIVGESYNTVDEFSIFLFYGSYDVPTKGTDGEWIEGSEEVYDFIVCAISPLEGEYEPGKPEFGFLFPAFVDRSSDSSVIDIFNADPDNVQTDLMEKILGVRV